MESIKSLESFSPFLAEIRKRVIFTLSVFALASLVGFFFYDRMIRLLINIVSIKGVNIVFTSPFQFINLAISCGIACGLVISFPFLVVQILAFLRPALRKKEYKMIIRFIPLSFILFLTGFSFGALIMKWQIEIFLTKAIDIGIGNILDISRLLTTIILTSAFMGIAFEFPILLLILMKTNLIKHEQLSKHRLWIYLGSFIFAILLPPDSILADILLSLPLIILFELTLLLSRLSKN